MKLKIKLNTLLMFLFVFAFAPLCSGKNALLAEPIKGIYGIGGIDGAARAGTVPRASAIKAVALASRSKSEIDSLRRVINFKDVSIENWYDRYINAAFTDGFISGGDGYFRPDEPLLTSEAAALLDNISTGAGARLNAADVENSPISHEAWVSLLVEAFSEPFLGNEPFGGNIAYRDFTALVTGETYPAIGADFIITDTGAVGAAGVNFSPYIDKKARVIIRDNEVIAIIGVISDTPTLKGALVTCREDGYAAVSIGGAERTYKAGDSFKAGQAPFIGDVCVSGKTALSVEAVNTAARGVISRVNGDEVTLSGERPGVYKISGGAGVYSVLGGRPAVKTLSDISVGAQSALFFIREGQIAGVIIDSYPRLNNIRVLISVTGYAGYIHKKVSLSSGGGLLVEEDGKITAYKPGEAFVISGALGKRRVKVTAAGGGKIRINSISRDEPKSAAPEYRGTIELSGSSGGICVVNELPLEEYLYAVVPSETPTGYGLEALKCQAVTARSYAYALSMTNKYAAYGANVDDSVLSQVYNNIPENELSRRAVDETAGLFLTYEGAVVMANFFSTSAGATANYGEVWGGDTFPGETPGYLSSVKCYAGDYGDLSAERNAAAFFKSAGVESYDAAFPWFRWSVSMTAKQIEAAINKNIAARYAAAPGRVKTWDGSKWVSKPIKTVGSVKAVEAVARGEGGNVTKLKITGSAAVVLIEAELNIRSVLSPSAATVRRVGAPNVKGYGILPSAFFVIENNGGNYTFYGGGNGHGVGMSQNGAKAMADAGRGFEEILAFYFKGANVERIGK